MSDHQQVVSGTNRDILAAHDVEFGRRLEGSNDNTEATSPNVLVPQSKPGFTTDIDKFPRLFRKKPRHGHSNKIDGNIDGNALSFEEENVSTTTSSSDYTISPREAKSIHVLRFAVLFVWLAAACCVSYGAYWYTRRSEFHEFEIQYRVEAENIVESLHTTMDKRLGAVNTLATALTMYAKCSNSTFPFVTMPDFVVPGSNARILADAAIVQWLPLMTDETRKEWEDYAYANRHQADEELIKDQEF
jgi:hypothetical protein